MTLEQRIETYKREARVMQKELGDKSVKVTNEYEYNVHTGCDHCGRAIRNQRKVLVDGRPQQWGLRCAQKAMSIELFLTAKEV